MGKIRTIELRVEQLKALQEGYQLGKTHAFRRRCQLVLLKSEGRTFKEVSRIIKMNEISINTWLDRDQSEGIAGLMTKTGRGRKQVFERQRLTQAKVILVKELNKQFSLKSLNHFLKSLTADIN
jgi:transposase